jgi:hypothetical protein
MSDDQGPKKIGGEYGDIRARIDIEKLNAYLAEHVQTRTTIQTPIEVKQFKACIGSMCAFFLSKISMLTSAIVWTGTLNLCCLKMCAQ